MTNIILLTIDCFRYDRCGFNGHHRNTTPFLDKLARESIIFDNAFATGPYTTESAPGIFAGQHSFNGCYFNSRAWKAIPENSETIASYLNKHGYETLAVLSNPHMTESRNFDLGFDSFRNLQIDGKDPKAKTEDDSSGFSVADYAHEIKTRMRKYDSLLTPYTIPYVAHRLLQTRNEWPAHRAEYVLQEFADGLKDAVKPVFGWTHLMDLHAPIHPDVGDTPVYKNLLADADRVVGVDSDRYRQLYDHGLRYVDQQIWEFVSKLKSAGIWDETVLLITADHGEALFDRKEMYGHPRHHHYDELLHVPMLVRVPDVPSQRIQSPFSLAWIHELLAELISEPPGNFPSESGNNSFLADEPAEVPVISDTVDENGHTIAIRDDSWKYIRHNVSPPQDFWYPFGDDEQAYHYITDQGERNPADISNVSDLSATAESYLTAPESLPKLEGEFSREMEEQLEDLGYKM
ncbi:sulfatase-like hydrolase/transferase [Haloarcula hispanica]|uniref:sulfatase-like hydrolase/transferase n=1 Tax=Haloarcula hispanica TaxID=51589 RepID=UPI0011B65C83|nr:sulfatase-like hydrolase/transferase [Haloarcula hispanica]